MKLGASAVDSLARAAGDIAEASWLAAQRTFPRFYFSVAAGPTVRREDAERLHAFPPELPGGFEAGTCPQKPS